MHILLCRRSSRREKMKTRSLPSRRRWRPVVVRTRHPTKKTKKPVVFWSRMQTRFAAADVDDEEDVECADGDNEDDTKADAGGYYREESSRCSSRSSRRHHQKRRRQNDDINNRIIGGVCVVG